MSSPGLFDLLMTKLTEVWRQGQGKLLSEIELQGDF
jgi:hypothetical protein